MVVVVAVAAVIVVAVAQVLAPRSTVPGIMQTTSTKLNLLVVISFAGGVTRGLCVLHVCEQNCICEAIRG